MLHCYQYTQRSVSVQSFAVWGFVSPWDFPTSYGKSITRHAICHCIPRLYTHFRSITRRPFMESKNCVTKTTVCWFDFTKIEVYVPRFKYLVSRAFNRCRRMTSVTGKDQRHYAGTCSNINYRIKSIPRTNELLWKVHSKFGFSTTTHVSVVGQVNSLELDS